MDTDLPNSQEPIPSISRVFESLLSQSLGVEASGINDAVLSSYNFLLDKNLPRALQIIDSGGVRCLQAEKSKRTVFQVRGKSASDNYLVFPEHYCSCQAFFYEVVGRSEAPYCKHQIAARLADRYNKCPVVIVPDQVLTEILLNS